MGATVTPLQSLDGSKSVSFHMFSLAEERCLRLLVKNLGKLMHESAVREEVGTLGITLPGSYAAQLRAPRSRQSPHSSLHNVGGARDRRVEGAFCHHYLRLPTDDGGEVGRDDEPLKWQRCHRIGHTRRICGYTPQCIAGGGFPG